MTVTGIEEISKTRSRVFLDGASALVLYKGELRKYQIAAGKELKEDTLEELRTQVLPRRAKLRAMNLLKNRRYTEKQLMDKLLQDGYSQDIAGEAVSYVKSWRYIDDFGYACDYISCHMGKCSRREIEKKLTQKGIGRETISAAAAELADKGLVEDEEAVIRRLLEKKHYNACEADEKEKQRIYGYFYRKGFSIDLVRRVMEDSFA